ncbi:hypothetical protein ESA94_20515 [Lacibacter luteus]|uniref:Uncharacterized protein n=1 Tax=Lacibacter luteus TaxID=2508719 RepID=A0A4Q1CDF7_9BACT|nr:hypothetical protein [Lacibacter luteus]RXK57585.1 hypothetical protein ESA94_20515 [Lacibacter luteus]
MKLLTAFLLLAMLCSCGTLRKLKSNFKYSYKSDSVAVQTQTVDSTGTTVSKTDEQSGIDVQVEFEPGSKDTAVTIEIVTYPVTADDYIPQTIQVKTSSKPKGIKYKQQQKKQTEQQQTSAVKTNTDSKVAVSEVAKAKEVDLVKKRVVVSWWWYLFLLLALLLVLYRYRKPILAFIKSKIIIMKKFFLVAITGLFLFGCGVAPDKTNTKVEERQSLMRPDNPLDWEHVYVDSVGKYAVLKQVNGKGT